MQHTGKCLCGAVPYKINDLPLQAAACHCAMCRKWSGGVYLAFEGDGNIAHYPSSQWTERGFCKTCGSSLSYRATAAGPHSGTLHVGLGTLDNGPGVALDSEDFIDAKPDGYAFAGNTRKMAGTGVFAAFEPKEADL